MTLCFKANGEPNLTTLPDWLSVEYSFDVSESRFYSIWVVSWIAEPALILGTLNFDGSVEGWISHLENIGFEDIVQVSCREFFGTKAERRR